MKYSNGKKYDQQMDNPYVQLWYEMVEHYLRMYLPKSGRVLDAGGGTGEFSIRVANINKNLKIINCDISEEMLEKAQEKFESLELHKRIENKICDIMNLSFENDLFDYVMCLGDAFSFCEDNNQAFDELVRVTKPSGKIHLSVNAFWGNFFGMMAKGPDKKFYFEDVMNYYQTHIIHQNCKSMKCKSFTIEELEELGRKHNLRIIKEFAAPIFTIFGKWLVDAEKLKKIKELQYRHCEDKNLLNFGNHLNIIFEK
ncbi:class I SAM-dependent methyltransferase [candidate division WOR-3 bacterium]|nr:class I SAM-dependent methyltransferase [candidate division WOR-3 bacterium]